jgi:hypothetical protein
MLTKLLPVRLLFVGTTGFNNTVKEYRAAGTTLPTIFHITYDGIGRSRSVHVTAAETIGAQFRLDTLTSFSDNILSTWPKDGLPCRWLKISSHRIFLSTVILESKGLSNL